MVKKPEIQYIDKFYVHGSEARVLELKPKRRIKTTLPLFAPDNTIKIAVDPVAIGGIVVALALVLPGISTSHMLLVLGIYAKMSGAIDTTVAWVKSLLGGPAVEGAGAAITFLALLVISTLIGVFLITRPLEWTMKKFPHQTYCVIMGFVVGSLADIAGDIVWPALQVQASTLSWVITAVVSLVTLAAGCGAILYLSRFSEDE